MMPEKDYWIETSDKTFLYYRVRGRSRQEALEKFLNGEGEFTGCHDECNETVVDTLEERPYLAWTYL